MQIIDIILVLIIGYVLGSISLGYLLGKLIKGKKYDIRDHGKRKNFGVSNVYHVLGIWPAVLTAIFDLIKGVIPIIIAISFHLSIIIILLSGLVAILGHIFPFYLKFRGGKGAATAFGILIFGAILYVIQGIKIPLILLIGASVILIILFMINRANDFVSICIIPIITALVLLYEGVTQTSLIISMPLAFLFVLGIIEIVKRLEKKLTKTEKSLLKRKFLRPLAAIFPIGLLFFNRWYVLVVVGVVFLAFVIMEILRFLKPKLENFPLRYKKSEKRKVSSMTLFLFSAGLTILIFNKYVAALSLFFLIFGDLAAWSIGKSFGKRKILDKTLEGSIAFLLICTFISLIFIKLLHFNPIIALAGAIVATLVELAPVQDDNLAVPIASAIVMAALSAII
jgi:glycerol-3-phosphate acyltransferase PlsY